MTLIYFIVEFMSNVKPTLSYFRDRMDPEEKDLDDMEQEELELHLLSNLRAGNLCDVLFEVLFIIDMQEFKCIFQDSSYIYKSHN